MPTHFHILLRVIKNEKHALQKDIGIILSSYTKAINKRHSRNGALFQPHTKAKEIHDEKYLLTLISYIHQNPIRSRLVDSLNDWQHSSYRFVMKNDHNSCILHSFYERYFRNREEFIQYSEDLVRSINKDYWIG
jgi:hypothetical protein